MEIFKKSKEQPIKLRGFEYIGFDENHPNVCYYYKKLDRNNFELMTCHLEGDKKPEIGAGTNVTVVDCFMANYLKYRNEEGVDIINQTIENTFFDFEAEDRDLMAQKFNSKFPKELAAVKKEIDEKGFKVLYCSNDESEDRKLGVVNIVAVKDEHIQSSDKRLEIDKHYTIFKPFKFMTSPAYLRGESKAKYIDVPLNEIVIDNDLLI